MTSAPPSIPLLSVGSFTSCTYRPPNSSPACAGAANPATARTQEHSKAAGFIGFPLEQDAINASRKKTCRRSAALPRLDGGIRREQHQDVERQIVANGEQRDELEQNQERDRS